MERDTMRRHSIFAIIAWCLFAAVSNGQERQLTYEDVKAIAREAVQKRQFEYDLPKVIYNRPILTVAFGNFYLPTKSPIDRAVELLANIEVIRAGYGKNNVNGAFWEPRLLDVEKFYKPRVTQIVYSPLLTDDEKGAQLTGLEKSVDDYLTKALDDWCKNNGWKMNMLQTTNGALSITLQTLPEGEIKIIHLVQFVVAVKEMKDLDKVMEYVPNGTPYKWSGTHVVKVSFPQNKSFGPKPLHFEKDGILTFSPDGSQFKEGR